MPQKKSLKKQKPNLHNPIKEMNKKKDNLHFITRITKPQFSFFFLKENKE